MNFIYSYVKWVSCSKEIEWSFLVIIYILNVNRGLVKNISVMRFGSLIWVI